MDYFEENLKVFRTCFVEKIREEREALLEDKEIIVSADQLGESIFGVKRQDNLWMLNSQYDARKAAKEYAERYQKDSDYKMFFIFGMSDGKVVEELLKFCNNTNRIIVYEPDKKVLIKFLENVPLKKIFEKDIATLMVEGLTGELEDLLNGEISYYRRNLMEVCILPNYDVLYPKECEHYIDSVISTTEKTVMYKNTYLHFNKMVATNMISNVYDMLNQYDIHQLKKQFEQVDLTGIPAIIVSAGPSLDQNIAELKNAEGKAFIVTVDAALRSTARAGIHINMAMSVDGETPERFFDAPELDGVPYAVELHSNALTMECMKGKRFYFNAAFGWWREIAGDTLEYTIPTLPVGGSVSTDAFELVRFLGFKTVILIGQDLAFTNGKGHTDTFHDEEGENEKFAEDHAVEWVEDVDGNQIQTDVQMKWYLSWFNKQCEKYKEDLRIIDATQGGARIKGTIIQTLKETIEQECKKEEDFDRLIELAPKTYDEESRKVLFKRLVEWKDKIEGLKQEFSDGIKEYRKIKAAYESQTVDTEELKEMAEKLDKWNKIDQKETTMEILSYYNVKVEYEIQDSVWQQKDSEITDITEKGIQLFEGYVKALEEFEVDLERLLLAKIRETKKV